MLLSPRNRLTGPKAIFAGDCSICSKIILVIVLVSMGIVLPHRGVSAHIEATTQGVLSRPMQMSPLWRPIVQEEQLPTALNSDDEVVYLDANGYIRVWDPQEPSGLETVRWVSPTGGWRDFTLADVNQDGDMEVLAVGGEARSGRLTIYDPVISTGTIIAEQITNTIPWAILFETTLAGRPLTVRTGEFDPDTPGPELALVYELNPEDKTDSDDETRLTLWRGLANAGDMDGTAWEEMDLFVDVGITWEHMAVGDLDNALRDEVVLVDDSVGLVRVYRLEDLFEDGRAFTELTLFYENKSVERPWLDGKVVRFVPGALQQMALARSSGPGTNTLWVLYYNTSVESNFADSYAEFLLPPPRTIFAGDIDGNDDDELFLLRDVPASAGVRPHLIMRNYNNEQTPLPTFEVVLEDNGYTAGTTGDVDGDGHAEVIIMRNNNLRLYLTPETGTTTNPTNFVPPALTDGRVVHAGNLDRNGYLKIPKLGVSSPQLVLQTYIGERISRQFRLSTVASGAPGPIPFTLTIPNAPAWLSVTPLNGETTADITVTGDAATLDAGTYEATIVIESTDPTVDNSPYTLPVIFEVLPGLILPTDSLLIPLVCAAESQVIQRGLSLDGPAGLIFAAEILATTKSAIKSDTQQSVLPQSPSAVNILWPSAVTWVTATSPNVLPATMELTFHPASLDGTARSGNAQLEIAFYSGATRQTRTIDLAFFCVEQQIYLPLLYR